MGNDPSDYAGLIAVILLASGVVAAWFGGRRVQRSEDRALAERVRAERSERAVAAATDHHASAVERLDAEDLRAHNDDLAERILGDHSD